MFLLRNKKNIDTFWLKKASYQELWSTLSFRTGRPEQTYTQNAVSDKGL